MTQEILDKTIQVIESILSEKTPDGTITVAPDASMDNMAEWDSLNFINIFLAINEAFDIDPDPDDAMSYRSVDDIVNFVKSNL